MKKFYRHPKEVDNYFDITSLRKTGGDETNPNTAEFVFTTDQSTLSQMTILIKGTIGEKAVVDWDDGNIEEYIYTGADQIIHHDYIERGSYDISISGAIGELTTLTLNTCNLINFAWTKGDGVYKMRDFEVAYNSLTHLPSFEGLTDLNYINIKENNITVNDLNKTLVTVNESGITGGAFHADGADMSAPTGEGLTAKNALIARGWTVVTN